MRQHYHTDIVNALLDADLIYDEDTILPAVEKAPTHVFACPIRLAWYLYKADQTCLNGHGYTIKTGPNKGRRPVRDDLETFYATVAALHPIQRSYRNSKRDQYVLFLPQPRPW